MRQALLNPYTGQSGGCVQGAYPGPRPELADTRTMMALVPAGSAPDPGRAQVRLAAGGDGRYEVRSG